MGGFVSTHLHPRREVALSWTDGVVRGKLSCVPLEAACENMTFFIISVFSVLQSVCHFYK